MTATLAFQAMQTAGARASRQMDVARIRAAGESRAGFTVTGPDGVELGVLIVVQRGQPELAVVACDGSGPAALVAGLGAAAGALAWHVVQQAIRAPRRAERAMRRDEARRARRPHDPFDAEVLASLTPPDT